MSEKIFSNLQALGVELVPVKDIAKPVANVLDIHNLKEMATLVCDGLVSAINKEGWGGYAEHIFEVYPALKDSSQIGAEVMDMTTDEWNELVELIEGKLSQIKGLVLEGEFKEIVENIAFHVVGLGVNVYKLITLIKK